MGHKEHNSYGRYFEDFYKGQVFRHDLSKTIFESDNNLFSLLTMNHHPVHLSNTFANESDHGRILVVGTLVFSISVGMTVSDISGKAIANLGYRNINHTHPVFINDTIRVESEVLSCKESKSKPDRGIIEIESRVFNQDGKMVLLFERSILVKKGKRNE